MKILLFILFILLNTYFFSQQSGHYPRILSRTQDSDCENEIKVKDVKVTTCSPDNCHSYLYPVLIEDFDNNFDLPNKWAFSYGYTDDDNNGNSTYMAGGYFYNNDGITVTNNNVQVDNGILKLVNKYESSHGYNFTSGMIKSLNNFEYGTFEARIKIPTANKMWPAFWLLNSFGNYSEIDIFEFWDNDVSGTPCSLYNDHMMSTHVGPFPNTNICHRQDKYTLDDIDSYHVYKLEWNAYEISIFVDNQKKGYATKFYDGNSIDDHCHYGTSYTEIDPKYSYSCNTLQGLEDNWYEIYWPQKPSWWPNWLWWPNIPQFLYYPNKIREDSYFPSANRAMSLIINNGINKKYKNETFSEFSDSSQTLYVDWVRIYQSFCCGENKLILNINDFDYQSKNTGYLTGQKLSVGISEDSANFKQEKPSSSNGWRDIPFIFLATEEIAINSEAVFEGDVYTEMRITDCFAAFKIIPDSNINGNNEVYNHSINSENQNVFDQQEPSLLKDKKEQIGVYPVPATDKLNLACDDVSFKNIVSLKLLDITGTKYDVEKSYQIKIDFLSPGYYQLVIELNDNTTLYKRVIKL